MACISKIFYPFFASQQYNTLMTAASSISIIILLDFNGKCSFASENSSESDKFFESLWVQREGEHEIRAFYA